MCDDLVNGHLIQRLRWNDIVMVLHHVLESRWIGRGKPAELEALHIHLDCDAIDLDCLFDCFRRQRQQAALIGIAEHHDVGCDGVAKQRFGWRCEVEEGRVLLELGLENGIELSTLEIEVAVEDEVRRRDDVAVDDADGASGFAKCNHVLRHRYDFVRGKHEISRARHNARAGDIGGVLGEPNMAQNRTTLLS